LSEDVAKGGETSIQEITDRHIALVDKHLAAKEKEIMSV
jgi:ribosome recycling factor